MHFFSLPLFNASCLLVLLENHLFYWKNDHLSLKQHKLGNKIGRVGMLIYKNFAVKLLSTSQSSRKYDTLFIYALRNNADNNLQNNLPYIKCRISSSLLISIGNPFA